MPPYFGALATCARQLSRTSQLTRLRVRALVVGPRNDVAVSAEVAVAALVAFFAGLATSRAHIALTERVNFCAFVLLLGVVVIAGAV